MEVIFKASNPMRMDWEKGEFVEIKPTILEVGQRVYGELGFAFNDSGVFYVYSEPNEKGVQLMVEDGGRNRFANWECKHDDRPYSKKFGIGYYYDDSEDGKSYRMSADELQRLYQNCKAQEEKEKQEEIERQRQRDIHCEELKKKYSYLKLNPQTTKERTDNVRLFLKRRFPDIKFSVRKESCDTLQVSYEDGLIEKKVSPAVRLWQDSHSDFTGDYWDYDPSDFNTLFGGFSYTFVSRGFSDKTMQKVVDVLKSVKNERGVDSEKYDRTTIYKAAERLGADADGLSLDRFDEYDEHNAAMTILYHLDIVEEKQEKKCDCTENQGIKIFDYSDKAIAVIGDTRSIKDTLKSLGGRFNARLSCGAGWIFSKRMEDKVRNVLLN